MISNKGDDISSEDYFHDNRQGSWIFDYRSHLWKKVTFEVLKETLRAKIKDQPYPAWRNLLQSLQSPVEEDFVGKLNKANIIPLSDGQCVDSIFFRNMTKKDMMSKTFSVSRSDLENLSDDVREKFSDYLQILFGDEEPKARKICHSLTCLRKPHRYVFCGGPSSGKSAFWNIISACMETFAPRVEEDNDTDAQHVVIMTENPPLDETWCVRFRSRFVYHPEQVNEKADVFLASKTFLGGGFQWMKVAYLDWVLGL